MDIQKQIEEIKAKISRFPTMNITFEKNEVEPLLSIISNQSTEIKRQREAIESVIAELEENAKIRMIQETKTFNAGGTGYVIDREARRAYEVAVRLLKEVLADADRNSGNPPEPE